MKFFRKGSMQLSIEAIIILVIAMVLLGLGIAFISGFFGKGTEKLMEPFDAIQFGCDPNSGDPIKTSPTNIQLKSSDTLNVKMCVYNGLSADANLVTLGIESCVNTGTGATPSAQNAKPKLLTQAQTIKRTETGGYGTILTASDVTTKTALEPATYICTLTAVKTTDGKFPATITESSVVGRKQITITVT